MKIFFGVLFCETIFLPLKMIFRSLRELGLPFFCVSLDWDGALLVSFLNIILLLYDGKDVEKLVVGMDLPLRLAF